MANTNVLVQSARQLVNMAGGSFMTLEFRKADGRIRRLNGRLGVYKHLKSPFSDPDTADTENKVTVWEANRNGKAKYRSVRLDRIVSLKLRGVEFKFHLRP